MDIKDFENLETDEIKLELTIGSIDKKFFYYKIFDINSNYIGNCGIRLNSDEYLGNIEYEIFSLYNGNNYAYKACKLLSAIASCYNINSLIITASPTNIPSIKTIKKLGSKFIIRKSVPKSHRLYKTSEYVNIYRWELEKGKSI